MSVNAFPRYFLEGRLVIKVGDITEEAVDAIVNAANRTLLGGGGVDGVIHRRGGPAILEACRAIRRDRYPDGLPAGEAVTTAAGRLTARYVIHTAGPVWSGGGRGEEALLRSCYFRSLAEAGRLKLSTVAIPAISTGVYRFPKDRAARVASNAIAEFLSSNPKPEKVYLVFFSEDDACTFLASAAFEP